MDNYEVIQCNEGDHIGKLWLVKDGKIGHIKSLQSAIKNGIILENIKTVALDEFNKYEIAFDLFKPINNTDAIYSRHEAYEFIVHDLKGKGIEYSNTSKVIDYLNGVSVEYAQLFPPNAECAIRDVGAKYYTPLDSLYGIINDSLDFIIVNNDINTTPKFFRALEQCHLKLKQGGTLILIVPHKDLSFDKYRELTSIDHLAMDYNDYMIERDFMHIAEYFQKKEVIDPNIKKVFNEERALIYDKLNEHLNGKLYITMHTFTPSSFTDCIEWFNNNIKEWSQESVFNPFVYEGCNEFIVKLVK